MTGCTHQLSVTGTQQGICNCCHICTAHLAGLGISQLSQELQLIAPNFTTAKLAHTVAVASALLKRNVRLQYRGTATQAPSKSPWTRPTSRTIRAMTMRAR